MQYRMEEIVEIVGELAARYAGYGNSSVTYEKASQLMEAVLFCINEAEAGGNMLIAKEIPARKAYEAGYEAVERKTRDALILYNEIMLDFDDYGAEFLKATLAKGMPEFFRRYDIRFNPQADLLPLDYVVLEDLSKLHGIDRIREYLNCIRIEQIFLRYYPRDYIVDAVCEIRSVSGLYTENLCETVLMKTISDIPDADSIREKIIGGISEKDVADYIAKCLDGVLLRLKVCL